MQREQVQATAECLSLAKDLAGAGGAMPSSNAVMSQERDIDTGLVTDTFIPTAQQYGDVVLDLFGGMGVGLEAALKCGLKVKRYLHVDTDESTTRVCKHRLADLQHQYSHLLLPGALHNVSALPQDVCGTLRRSTLCR